LLRFSDDDGRIEIDSNTVEHFMKPVSLNRKNALFADTNEGTENPTMNSALTKMCKLHGTNLPVYKTGALTKLLNT